MDKERGLVEAVDYYPNGRVRFRGSNLGGEMHGPWEFYRLDGSLMRAGTFERGRQVGVWRTYDRSGAIVKETRFS
jgi:antitoxin component YwqK of YwqJK toxin-antitoxin module